MNTPPLPLRYLPPADVEYSDQVAYYHAKASGLGAKFTQSIKYAEQLIQSNPAGRPVLEGTADLRAVVVRKFPYRLLYALRDGYILIVAVAPTARDPGRFLGR